MVTIIHQPIIIMQYTKNKLKIKNPFHTSMQVNPEDQTKQIRDWTYDIAVKHQFHRFLLTVFDDPGL